MSDEWPLKERVADIEQQVRDVCDYLCSRGDTMPLRAQVEGRTRRVLHAFAQKGWAVVSADRIRELEAENKALRDERGVTPEAIERAAYAIAEVVAARRCEGIPAVQDQRRAEAKAALEAATLSPAPVSDADEYGIFAENPAQ